MGSALAFTTMAALGGQAPPPRFEVAPPGTPIYVDPSELTRTERFLVAATPIVTLGSIIGLGYPPYAALTRWRVQHNPRSSVAISKDGSTNKTYWKIIKDVRQREGTKGLYKGLFLNLSVGIAPWITVLGGYGILRLFPKAAPVLLSGALAQLGWQVLTTLVTLPFEILSVRALVTPHAIPLVSPFSNLRLLLTADERSHPFRCLYTPSRFLASFLPTLLAPQLVLAIGVRTPLAVIAARLHAQRQGGTGAAIVHQKGEESATTDGVVQTRPTPYANLLDCARTIVREEGWSALWRGWPLEAILALRNYS